jgi:hypothetical protein
MLRPIFLSGLAHPRKERRWRAATDHGNAEYRMAGGEVLLGEQGSPLGPVLWRVAARTLPPIAEVGRRGHETHL